MMPVVKEITDFNAPELDIYARLTENQLLNRHEPEKGIFIAESPKVIERALDAGCVPISFLAERREAKGTGRELIRRCGNIPVYVAELDVLAKLTGFPLTRGMLCAMYRPPLRSVEEVCAGARRIAVLENVVNPTNVGAIFRSAAALNMDAVLQQSPVPPGHPGEHGKCVSGALDVHRRPEAGGECLAGGRNEDSEKTGIPDGRHGPRRPLHIH